MVRFGVISVILLVICWTGSMGQDEVSSFETCATNVSQTWIVNDTASAKSLAEAVNCSGGSFNVIWSGSVSAEHTIVIREGTTLNVTGEGSEAEINGGGEIRLFMAVGANLHINGLTLRNGNATYGGAMYVTSSNVLFDGNVSLINNTASYDGGALYISDQSSVSWYGETSFANNMASVDGGAMRIQTGSIALWGGKTSFVNNTALDDGGTMYVDSESTVSWLARTSFVNNMAGNHGGALYLFNSTASCHAEALFIENTANCDGGALYISDQSSVSWYRETSFIENTASCDGGAWYLRDTSIVSWYGETSFVNNSAINGGAAFVSDHSRTLWHGVTSFVNNFAGGGGALSVLLNSTAVWNGETSFVNNTADYAGGAMLVWGNSFVSWDGAALFVNNSANNGGALAVFDNANALWTGKTSFTVNNAISNGGAIYLNLSSGFIMGGYTDFYENTAGIDGGAAFVYSGFDDSIPSHFIVNYTATVSFERNACGENGGAAAVFGGVVTRFLLNSTFYENTAGLFGGAIYMSGVTAGFVFQSSRFVSNSAVIGGAIYSTDSETYLIGCTFIANAAERIGGAMDSGEGRDMIVNTSFVGNSAMIGGALSLIGISALVECEFVENSANGDEGPAISNDGVISSISRCSFVDNTFNCEPGYYLEYNDTSVMFDNVCKGCDIECSGCTVEGKEPTKCVETLEHSSALGVRTTLESLSIAPGYWRATTTSDYILACYNSKACLGGVTGEKGYCLEGYKGPYCSVCSTGYTRGLGYVCNKCFRNAATTITIAVAVVVIFLLASFAFLSYMLCGKMNDTDHSIVARIISFIPLQSVKIVIVVWQILTQFSTVANAVFPSIYQRFLDGVNIFNFDLSWVLSIGFMIDTDFNDQLLLATMGPLVCMVILGGTYIAAMGRSNHSEEARGIVGRKHLSMVLLLTFLVYSSVSLTLFKAFACDELEDGNSYLRADYRIECDSSKHDALEIYAGFMIVLYVVGIPTFYGVVLYNNRDALLSSTGREEDERIKPITDLWVSYRPVRFYYEVIECVRRVLLTGALVFIYPNTAGQIAVALMIATFFIFVSKALGPYESLWDAWCNRMGHAIVFTSMFLALLLKVEVSRETAKSQVVFESVLVAVHSCLIIVVLIEAFTMFMGWWKEVKEDIIPRVRPSLTI